MGNAPPTSHRLSLQMLLKALVDKGASDLHIRTDTPPQLRLHGRLVALRTHALTPAESKELCLSALAPDKQQVLLSEREVDISFEVKGLARFRANIFYERGNLAAAIRIIPFSILTLDELAAPAILGELCRRPSGLILVVGPTGSGKSTTLAAMIDQINGERFGHIVTLENPIEYIHNHKSCIVSQREIGADTHDFKHALRSVLRQDPDVILVGEIRDLETMEAAISLAETGHLTFATLHTNSAVQTVNRIIDSFPGPQQAQTRAQLSFVLQAVCSQQLVPKLGGGRILVTELLIVNSAIRNLIREDKVHQIYSQMQVGRAQNGMYTMNQSLADLVQRRRVKAADALDCSPDEGELRKMLEAPRRSA